MSQSRGMSLLEAVTNVLAGWLVALATQLLVFPPVGLQATVAQNLALSSVFTAVSLVRSYLLRRLFVRMADQAPWQNSCASRDSPSSNQGAAPGRSELQFKRGNRVFPHIFPKPRPAGLCFGCGVAAWSYAAYSVRICFRGGSTPASPQHTLGQRLKRPFKRVIRTTAGQRNS